MLATPNCKAIIQNITHLDLQAFVKFRRRRRHHHRRHYHPYLHCHTGALFRGQSIRAVDGKTDSTIFWVLVL